MTATATTAAPADLDDDEGTGVVAPELKDAGTQGIISLRSAVNPPEDARVPAFRINGKTYSIATKPRTNQGLQYVHLSRTRGTEIAIDYALEMLLGAEGYKALREFDDLTEADLEAVVKAASRIMTGPVEAPKGKPKNASRRSRG